MPLQEVVDSSDPSGGDVRTRVFERFRPYAEGGKLRELAARRYRGRKLEGLIRRVEFSHDPDVEDAMELLRQAVDRIVKIAEDNAAGSKIRYQFVALGEPRTKSLQKPELAVLDEWIESEEMTAMTRESELVRALSVHTDWAKAVADLHVGLMKVANDSVDRIVKISEKLGDQLVNSEKAKYEYEWKWHEKKYQTQVDLADMERRTKGAAGMWEAFGKGVEVLPALLDFLKSGRNVDEAAPTDAEIEIIFGGDDPEIADLGKLFKAWVKEKNVVTRREQKARLDELAAALSQEQRNAIRTQVATKLKPERVTEIGMWLALNGIKI